MALPTAKVRQQRDIWLAKTGVVFGVGRIERLVGGAFHHRVDVIGQGQGGVAVDGDEIEYASDRVARLGDDRCARGVGKADVARAVQSNAGDANLIGVVARSLHAAVIARVMAHQKTFLSGALRGAGNKTVIKRILQGVVEIPDHGNLPAGVWMDVGGVKPLAVGAAETHAIDIVLVGDPPARPAVIARRLCIAVLLDQRLASDRVGVDDEVVLHKHFIFEILFDHDGGHCRQWKQQRQGAERNKDTVHETHLSIEDSESQVAVRFDRQGKWSLQ